MGLLLSAGVLHGEELFDADHPESATDVRFGRAGQRVMKGFRLPRNDSVYEAESPPQKPVDPVLPAKVTVTPSVSVPAKPEDKPGVRPPAPVPTVVAPPTMGELIEAGRFAEVAVEAEARRDAPLAQALAWAYYRKEDYGNSKKWFGKSAEWGGSGSDLVYGQAVAAKGDGDIESAMGILKPILKTDERARVFYSDIAAERAVHAYSEARYKEVIFFLHEAYKYRYLSTEEQLLLAWSYRNAGNNKRAGEIFEGLYRATRGKESADGMVAVYGDSDAGREHLAQVSRELGVTFGGGMILADPGDSKALLAYDAGRYFEAAAESPEFAKRVSGINGPSMYVGGQYVVRSGRSGLESLSTATVPLAGARAVLAGRHEVAVRSSAVDLDSGRPAFDSPIGYLPSASPLGPFTFSPTTQVSGHEEQFKYRYHGEISPFATFGNSPEGPVRQEPNGRLGLTCFGAKGMIEAEGFYLPVKDSLLSYTGIRDPWTGEKWGRVMSAGGKFSGRIELEDGYSVSGSGFASYLSGKHVEGNRNVGESLALRKDLPMEGFSYFAVGPGLSFVHYDKNLSKFTYGHGGYFSPKSLLQVDMGANMLTKEGRNWLAKVDALVGYQTNHQADAPYYPYNDDGSRFEDFTDSDMVFGLRGEAAVLLSPHWMIGGYYELSKSQNYDSYGIGLFFTFHFERRSGLYRQDLQLPIW